MTLTLTLTLALTLILTLTPTPTFIKDAGVWNQTVFIVTSDHGDMQMEDQQVHRMRPSLSPNPR